MEYSTRLYEENDIYRVLRFETEEEWLAGRNSGIGGSEVAAIVGMSPWKNSDELWKIKTGRKQAEQISNNKAVQYGKDAEEYIRQIYALDRPQYEVNYLENVILENKKYPFIHYSPDGLLYEKETGRKGILEIKTSEILRSVQREMWDDRIPDHYFCQVIQGLLTTDFDFIELRAHLKYNDEYTRVITRHIEKSEVLEDMEYVLNEEIKFWKHVLDDTEPPMIISI